MKIELDKVVEALKFTNIEIKYYYNPDTEEIFMSNIGEFENLTEDELDELFEKSIILPTRYYINEYKMMQDFVKTIKDKKIKNQLYNSLYGKGAFRRFKDTCSNFNIINDWYNFRNGRYKEIAINWCKKNNIEIESRWYIEK